MEIIESDNEFIKEAIAEAELGLEEGGIPIGSVLVSFFKFWKCCSYNSKFSLFIPFFWLQRFKIKFKTWYVIIYSIERSVVTIFKTKELQMKTSNLKLK